MLSYEEWRRALVKTLEAGAPESVLKELLARQPGKVELVESRGGVAAPPPETPWTWREPHGPKFSPLDDLAFMWDDVPWIKMAKKEEPMADDMVDVVGHVAAYLALQGQIAALKDEADQAKMAIQAALLQVPADPGTKWPFPGIGTVTLVKGRVSEKLDRTRLAKAGVPKETLDAATVRSEGDPYLRITGDDEGGEE